MDLESLPVISSSIEKLTYSLVIEPVLKLSYRTAIAFWKRDSNMPEVYRCYNKVRNELCEIGLLYNPEDEEEDGYLDQIELEVSILPSIADEAGYVFEEISWVWALAGYQEGVIYLPSDLPKQAYVPGGTLTDVIRHEYAHAWHWLEPEFFETGWFERAFGSCYEEDGYTPYELWSERKERERNFKTKLAACRNEREQSALLRRSFRNDFVSEYAATLFCEDFAETFMTFLRYRNCLDKFKSRTGVFAKLKAVEKAVGKARRELGL